MSLALLLLSSSFVNVVKVRDKKFSGEMTENRKFLFGKVMAEWLKTLIFQYQGNMEFVTQNYRETVFFHLPKP